MHYFLWQLHEIANFIWHIIRNFDQLSLAVATTAFVLGLGLGKMWAKMYSFRWRSFFIFSVDSSPVQTSSRSSHSRPTFASCASGPETITRCNCPSWRRLASVSPSAVFASHPREAAAMCLYNRRWIHRNKHEPTFCEILWCGFDSYFRENDSRSPLI